jgi:YfiH family protein
VTNEAEVALTIFSADCTPILFYDPVANAIGAAHAGWRGTAAGIALKVVEKMVQEFGSDPKNIRTAIGPCISQCCFETREDVPAAMIAALGEEAKSYILPKGEKYYVNLKGLNALWLRRAGVAQISIAQECTACEPHRFWSHRRVGDQRGSLAAVIMLGRNRV